MTATTHIAAPADGAARSRPLTGLRTWWAAFTRRALNAYFERARLARPVTDPDRHAWDSPALEDAFARLAADHPDTVTPADGGNAARETDREQLLLATCDAWFRDIHGPQHRWTPRTVTAYDRLQADVRACFHPGGTS